MSVFCLAVDHSCFCCFCSRFPIWNIIAGDVDAVRVLLLSLMSVELPTGFTIDSDAVIHTG